jgi:hypothetical protein
METCLNQIPTIQPGAYGNDYHILAALGHFVGPEAKPLFQKYVLNASTQRSLTFCEVFREIRPEWAKEFLTPLLSDKRTSELTHPILPARNEPRLPIRICDRAAETLAMVYKDLAFEMVGTFDDLDKQIENIKAKLLQSSKD